MQTNTMNFTTENTINSAPIRVGVIGAGNMGQHHMRFYSMLSNAKLVGVVDIDESRARLIAAKYNCQSFSHIEDLIGKVDAVSIAVPSQLHCKIGEFFLNHQIHCLIEKPLAISEEECTKLIQIAEKKGTILLVGHVEYFNPAVLALSNILKTANEIYSIDAKRMGWKAVRTPDVDVVLDLMVHDLQIINFLHDHEISNITAQGYRSILDNELEQVISTFCFSTGTIANVAASWISAKKQRSLEINSDIGTLSLDYATQQLFYYKKPPFATNSSYNCESQIEQIFVRYQEPLMLELQNFLQSVDAGVPLGVNGYQALNALKLVWRIQDYLVQMDRKHKLEYSSIDANLLVE